MTIRQLTPLVFLLAIVIFACSGEDDGDEGSGPGGGKPPAAMVGTWIFQSVTVDGAPANLADELEWHPGVVEARLHIQANSAYVYEEVNASGGQIWAESGFVFIDGNAIDINAQSNTDGPVNDTSRLVFALNGNVLTLQEVSPSSIVVITLTM